MVRSNLDLYPESFKKLTNITMERAVPRNRLLRSMIELVLTDPDLLEKSITLSKSIKRG